MFKIESKVPVPVGGRGRKPIYPWREMAVGDSFAVRGAAEFIRAKCAAWRHASNHGNVKFVTKANANGGRIWRVA